MWPTKVKFDWPLTIIGLKMANGQLLYCALYSILCSIISLLKVAAEAPHRMLSYTLQGCNKHPEDLL